MSRWLSTSFAIVALLLCFSRCSSNFETSRVAFPPKVTSVSDRQNLESHLSGEWFCIGTVDGGKQCNQQTFTFNSTLDQLVIVDYWADCQMKTQYQLTVQPENSDGMVDFSVHTDKLGELIGTDRPNVDCKAYLATFTQTGWDENFSLTHDAQWDQITINEVIFSRTNPSPHPSTSVSPSAIPTQLSKS